LQEKWVCTDGNFAYETILPTYSLKKNDPEIVKHVINKSETCLVEAKNSSLRDNLARLNRRTKKHSKSEEMLRLSVSLLLKKNKIKDYL
jgi:IS1 family transposase